MRLRGVSASRRTLADVSPTLDQGGRKDTIAATFAPDTRHRNGRIDGFDVVSVDIRNHVPTIGLEAAGGVIGKPVPNLAVDRDAVVVVQHDQL